MTTIKVKGCADCPFNTGGPLAKCRHPHAGRREPFKSSIVSPNPVMSWCPLVDAELMVERARKANPCGT